MEVEQIDLLSLLNTNDGGGETLSRCVERRARWGGSIKKSSGRLVVGIKVKEVGSWEESYGVGN